MWCVGSEGSSGHCPPDPHESPWETRTRPQDTQGLLLSLAHLLSRKMKAAKGTNFLTVTQQLGKTVGLDPDMVWPQSHNRETPLQEPQQYLSSSRSGSSQAGPQPPTPSPSSLPDSSFLPVKKVPSPGHMALCPEHCDLRDNCCPAVLPKPRTWRAQPHQVGKISLMN